MRIKPIIATGISRHAAGICLLAGCWLVGLSAHAADAPAVKPSGKYQFDGTISRQVLENFLARAISVEGVFNGRGDLDDNIRMLKALGVKYAGRSLCLWGAENNFLANIERAKQQTSKAIAADPEMVLEACVFEIVGPRVERIAVPDWVFTAFGQPVENRNFIFNDIIYPVGQRRSMGNGQVPDVSRLETQMWFYYQAVSYIDAGFEGIHFGQVEIMNRNDRGNAQWDRLLTMVRAYAAKHARRHMVLCNGHTPSGGLVHDGKLLLDFHAFPLRVKENPDKPGDAILQLGFSDGIYQRSKGGVTFSGWQCEHLPYLVELDNYGSSRTPGKPGAGPLWIWGYDEITWFAHQDKQYRADWLQYAWDWVRKTDPNGFLQMPGSRTASSPDTHWYFANNPSPACPTGMGDEDAIGDVWAAAGAYTPFDGWKSAWHEGFDRYDLIMDEQTVAIQPLQAPEGEGFGVKDPPQGQRRCIVVVPKQAAPGNPWSWRGCYWDHQPEARTCISWPE